MQRETGCASKQCEQSTFDQGLANQPVARRSERQPDGGLDAAGGAAREQQIGDVGASDEQHQAGDNHQQTQTIGIFAFHAADTTAGGRDAGYAACESHPGLRG